MPESGRSTQDAYERVRAAILNGELPPDGVTSQVALADELGVSRTPLREALKRLQSEGFIQGDPNRRIRVASMTSADLEELYIIRITLEAEAIRLTVPRLTPEDIGLLEGRMAEMAHFAAEHDYLRWTVPHRAFHRGLNTYAGVRTNALLDHLSDHAERYRRLHIGQAPSAWATRQHRDILDASKAGKIGTAASLLVEHLACTGFEVMELLDPNYIPERLQTAVQDAGGTPPTHC